MESENNKELEQPTMASGPPVGYEHEVLSPVEQRRYNRRMNAGAAVFNMMESLQELSSLPQGWDGYNAAPVSKQAMANMFSVLDGCQDEDIAGWQAYPEINGTLFLQNSELRAGINLGDKTFSYFVIHGNSVTGEDNLSFATPLFINTLRAIND